MRPELRSGRERVAQILLYEGLGLALITPLYGCVTAAHSHESLSMLVVLSILTTTWSALFNTIFDAVELRLTRRVASKRPHGVRIAHTLAFEATAMIASCPALVALAHLRWLDALQVDLALTVTYAVYGYGFHWTFDRLRPVQIRVAPSAAS